MEKWAHIKIEISFHFALRIEIKKDRPGTFVYREGRHLYIFQALAQYHLRLWRDVISHFSVYSGISVHSLRFIQLAIAKFLSIPVQKHSERNSHPYLHKFGTEISFRCNSAGEYLLHKFRSIVINVIYLYYNPQCGIVMRIEFHRPVDSRRRNAVFARFHHKHVRVDQLTIERFQYLR